MSVLNSVLLFVSVIISSSTMVRDILAPVESSRPVLLYLYQPIQFLFLSIKRNYVQNMQNLHSTKILINYSRDRQK